ncbi:hypothetical protein ACIRBX_25815 [Kitasatospora sp. NPDC096147]|uniref:hypothetical protein n=1 Tax=Kitasatospora sp. NPDC096147 TaxID=3364093 RepID=UPI0037FEB7C1
MSIHSPEPITAAQDRSRPRRRKQFGPPVGVDNPVATHDGCRQDGRLDEGPGWDDLGEGLTMAFGFSLIMPTVTRLSEEYLAEQGPLEEGAEYYGSLVMRGCLDLAETDAAFRIGGFGKDDWRFDVSYDMSAFVEGLQDLLEALEERAAFELDLYPPGVDRVLTFRFAEDPVAVECLRQTAHGPERSVELLPYQRMVSLCTTLAGDFAAALHAVGSIVADEAPFAEWRARWGSADPAVHDQRRPPRYRPG